MGSEEEKDGPTPPPDDSMAETIASDTPRAGRAEALFAEALGSVPEDDVASLPVDGKIGKFEIIEKIGTGGFGDVYRAQQFEPVEREVALKVLKPGMDSREIVGRFESERQALALMEHSNIAKVLDGGETPAGHPYFVMELVRGLPVTAYCDKKKLSIRERLGIFRQICAGVQHAHQKGIIHRDLKPSNILVEESDGKPIPKVIDFGVSKAITGGLSEWTVFTQAGQAIGTSQYMSPEQALTDEGGIDTRSDIFSLGVILYELLTGEPPITGSEFQEAGMLAFAEVIQKKTPLRPSSKIGTVADTETVTTAREMDISALRRTLRQDLDWIVMKALEKERNRRYDSATEFSEDIGRFLKYQPVLASPPSKWYAFKKFTRRQRGPILAGAAVFGAVVLGAVVSVWQAIRATEESERARIAERQSALQRDAVNAVNMVESNPRRALEIIQRVTDESDLLFGELSPPVTNALISVLDRARETSRMEASSSVDADLSGGASIAAVLSQNDCFIFDLEEGREQAKISVASGDDPLASAVALFPGGDRFLVGFENGKVKIFSVATGAVESEWDASDGAMLIAADISSDLNKVLLLSADGKLSRWSVDGEEMGPVADLGDTTVAEFFACDSRHEVVILSSLFAGDSHFQIVDFRKGERPVPEKIITARPAGALAVRADGQQFLTGHQDGTIQLWDRSGRPVGGVILAHRSPVSQVSFVEGTQFVASVGRDGEALVFGEGGEIMSPPMKGGAGKGIHLASFGGGRYLARMSDDGSLVIWDVLGVQARPGIFTKSTAEQVLFPGSRPDEMLVSLADGRVQALDWMRRGEVLREVSIGEEAVLRMKLNEDETVLAMSLRNRSELYLVDYPSLENVRKIPTDGTWILGLEFDGENVLAYDSGGELLKIDYRTGSVEKIAQVAASGNPSSDLIRLATPVGGYTHAVFGWGSGSLFSVDGNTAPITLRGIGASQGVETDRGIMVTSSGDLRIGIRGASGFEFDRNDPPRNLFSGPQAEQVAFHPIGRSLAAGSHNGLLRTLDSRGNFLSPILRADRIGLETVTIHPREPFFVTTGHEGWIRFWGSHPEVWKRILAERIARGLPESTFSIPPIVEKRQDDLVAGDAWAGVISVPEAGFSMRAHDSWNRASPASVAAINQLLVQSLGDKYKRLRFASVYFGEGKAKSGGLLYSDIVAAIEVPEYTSPSAFADRWAFLGRAFHGSLNKNFSAVFQMDSDSLDFEWDSGMSGVHSGADVVFRGGRNGRVESFWKPTRGSSVIVSLISSYEVVADDPAQTEANRAVHQRFISTVREQFEGLVIHESNRPSPEEIEDVRIRISDGSIELAERILGGESGEYHDLIKRSEQTKFSDHQASLQSVEKALLIAESKMGKGTTAAQKAVWRQRYVECLLLKSFQLRNLRRLEEASEFLRETLELSSEAVAGDHYSPFIHRQVVRQLYYLNWAANETAKEVAAAKEGIRLGRRIADRSTVSNDLKELSYDLIRLGDSYQRRRDTGDGLAAKLALEEAAQLAAEIRKDPINRTMGIELAVAIHRKITEFALKDGDLAAAMKAQEAWQADLRLLTRLRPGENTHHHQLVRALREQSLLQLKSGDSPEKAAETFRESLRESTRWIERFGMANLSNLEPFLNDTIKDTDFLVAVREAGETELLEKLQGEQITMIRSWPEPVRNRKEIVLKFSTLLREYSGQLFRNGSARLDTTGPLAEEAIAICRPFLNHENPVVRSEFIKSMLYTIAAHREAIKVEPVKTFGSEERRSEARIKWVEQGVPFFPESGDRLAEDFSALDRLSWISSELAWLLRQKRKIGEATDYAEKLLFFRKLQFDLKPKERKRLLNYASSYRSLIFMKDDAELPFEEIAPDISKAQSLFSDLFSKGTPEPADYLNRAEFTQTMARMYEREENYEEAVEAANAAISDLLVFLKSDPNEVWARVRIAECSMVIARSLVDSDEPVAIARTRDALAIYRELRTESPELSRRYARTTKGTIGFLKNLVGKNDPIEAAKLEAEIEALDSFMAEE